MIKIITVINVKNINAGPKAKLDIIRILKKIYKDNIEEENIYLYNENSSSIALKIKNYLKKVKILLKNIVNKDILVIQYPLVEKFDFISFFPKSSIIVVHDLQGLRLLNQKRIKKELKLLSRFNCIIVHNDKMKEYLQSNGVKENSLYVLELFDYLCENNIDKKNETRNLKREIAFVGNLKKIKTPFIYQMDDSKMKFSLNLYGNGIDRNINSKVIYKGAFPTDEIPNYIEESLGLVWDGNFDESDENVGFKNYLKYNNPHKLSCYIATGIPVIVWEKAAIADLVKKYNIGYTINNLYDINGIDLSEYNEKKKNVLELSKKVRNGYFTKKVFDEIMKDNL